LRSIADHNGEVHSSLEVVDLNHPPPYWALSYTWGDPEDDAENHSEQHESKYNVSNKPRHIYIDNTTVSVGANLYEALLIIKRYHQIFWVDAVWHLSRSTPNQIL
jgi:hypothetical protein